MPQVGATTVVVRRARSHGGHWDINDLAEVQPCTFCALELHVGARAFGIVDVVVNLFLIFVYFLEMMHMMGVMFVDFGYMSSKREDKTSENYGKSVAPTTTICFCAQCAQLAASILLVSGTHGRSMSMCNCWLFVEYFLIIPKVCYVFFATLIGTSVVALIVQVLFSTLYTPYAIWIIRKYVEWLDTFVVEGNHLVRNESAQLLRGPVLRTSDTVHSMIVIPEPNMGAVWLPNPDFHGHHHQHHHHHHHHTDIMSSPPAHTFSSEELFDVRETYRKLST